MTEIIIRLPDPASLTWEDRARLRRMTADAMREAMLSGADVGVDIVVEGE